MFISPEHFQQLWAWFDCFLEIEMYIHFLSIFKVMLLMRNFKVNANDCLFKVNNIKTRKRCETCSNNNDIRRKLHCLKSVQIRSFFWSVFSRIRTEYGEIQSFHAVLWRLFEVFIVHFVYILQLFLAFFLLALCM